MTACTQQPGTAATVEGERITQAELAATVEDLDTLNGMASDPGQVLTSLIFAPVVVTASGDAGVGVSQAEATALLDEVAATAGLEPWDYAPGTIQIAELQLVSQYTASVAGLNEEIAVRAAEADVEVNPLYGEWSGASGVQPTQWPWLLEPATAAVG
ncbi:hypothetical protein [Serinibacter salmoneus]|uniref:hypothetical protein n=1 Tax=Serinibacter salmoneus TaxID=556530 RepID=UPI000BF90377|nr:hypothetical protein [Serinibacter salmoneus]